jgi:predicted acyltransferase
MTKRLTDLSRFAYHVYMAGGLSQGFESEGAARTAAFLVRQAIMLGVVVAIALAYKVAGVAGSALAGQSAFALAALIPVATMHRSGVLTLNPAPAPEPHPAVMATELSAS